MKRIFFAILLILSLILLFSCANGSYSVLKGYERNTPTSMAMTYEKFNGYKQKSFTVGEDERATVYVFVVSSSGELDILIEKDGGEPVYVANDAVTSSFTIDITQSGEYNIRVEAKDHTGEYNFEWEIINTK